MGRAVFLIWGAAAVRQDVRSKRVSRRLLAAGCLLVMAASAAQAVLGSVSAGPAAAAVWRVFAGGAAAGGGVYLLSVLTKGAIGRGDAWFFAAAGFAFGAAGAYVILTAAMVFAGLRSAAGLISGSLKRDTRLPFFPYAYAAAWIVTLFAVPAP